MLLNRTVTLNYRPFVKRVKNYYRDSSRLEFDGKLAINTVEVPIELIPKIGDKIVFALDNAEKEEVVGQVYEIYYNESMTVVDVHVYLTDLYNSKFDTVIIQDTAYFYRGD